MISDLHWAIKSICTLENRIKVNTLLFRGGVITQAEINSLPQYIHSEIEFLSFLSTSTDKNVSTRPNFSKNALFIIYIP